MPPPIELCRNFQRGSCRYGERCKFSHANQQQAKPNSYGFGTQFQRTDSQPQKPNPFGFGVQNNSSKPNQFKPGENKWSRFSPINGGNTSAPQKPDNQTSAPNHVCTDSESCKRQIIEDFEQEKPLWKLTCYGHCKYGPCDIVGDISCEELRAAAYDDAKRGMNIQSIVEKERNLLSSKLIEFENLLRNPYKALQNSPLTTQNAFPATSLNAFPQNNAPPTASSFSQLGTGFQMRPAVQNYAFGQVNQMQGPTRISQNSFAFGNPGSVGSQSFVSPFPVTTTSSLGNAFSPNVDLGRSMPFGATGVPEPVSSVQMTQNIPISDGNGDNSIWLKEEWRPGEIPEEAPPEGVIY